MERSRYDRNDRSDRDRYRQDSPARGRYRSRSRSRDRDSDRDRDRDRNRNRDRNGDERAEKDHRKKSPDRGITRNHLTNRSESNSYTENVEKFSINELSTREKQRNQDDAMVTNKIEAIPDEEEIPDEDQLKAMELFMNEDEVEESEVELERLLLERKKRRQEILSKYVNTQVVVDTGNIAQMTSQSVVTVGDAHSKTQSEPIIEAIPLVGNSYENETFHQLEAEKSALQAEDTNKRYSTTFDIFSSSPSDLERELRRSGTAQASSAAMHDTFRDSEDPHLQSNWDDSEGYYRTRVGEVILDRYRTLGVVGKGVFSTVLKCADITKPILMDDQVATKPALGPVLGGLITESKFECVAIKMIRNNDTMRKAADKELAILTLLSKNDSTNKKHCVQLLERFEFRRHIALVFEFLPMNLREILKKFGKDVGINVGAIRLYARQLLVALRYLIDLKIVHADIKLDNILCSADLKQVKLCDFGSAFFENDPESIPTPYLVSRFYRAPEIILGQPYDHAIDLWSVAVSLYELFTGHLMFPGRSNNEMLKLFMSVKGRFPTKQLRTHLRQYESMGLDPHFDSDLRFKQQELDSLTGQPVRRLIEITQPTRDLTSMLRSAKAGGDDGQLVGAFGQLLDQCIALDPTKRISVYDALKHPFFTGK